MKARMAADAMHLIEGGSRFFGLRDAGAPSASNFKTRFIRLLLRLGPIPFVQLSPMHGQ